HELGEFAAERVFDRVAIDPRYTPSGSREEVANAIARRLLLPRRWFRKHGLICEWDLLELKEIFTTASHELIARRMLDTSTKWIFTLFDQGNITWRRSNFGRSAAPLLATERECWLESHELGLTTHGEAADPNGGEITIHCWPVHEPDWKREIMRMDLPDWE
ncbi:MAG: ImmA/IrrE family metallo-endopeptidase, partial [Aeoliella sp.]